MIRDDKIREDIDDKIRSIELRKANLNYHFLTSNSTYHS